MRNLEFNNNIVILGFGLIGRAVLPLIQRHLDVSISQIKIISSDFQIKPSINGHDIERIKENISKYNFKKLLDEEVNTGDFVVNLASGVCSVDLARFCSENGVLYLDTNIETWADQIGPYRRTYNIRKNWLKLREELSQNSTTSLTSIGANPGVVSLLAKRLVRLIAREVSLHAPIPRSRLDWAMLARRLTVRVLHINERDTQWSEERIRRNEFFSTWSVEAMIAECLEYAEMSIGSHESELPVGSTFCSAESTREIVFDDMGKDVIIDTWLPIAGEQSGMILNHSEALSLAEYFSLEVDGARYSPTVCFVYHPCDQTMASLRNLSEEYNEELNHNLLLEKIVEGRDELGVLAMTKEFGSFWLGSSLDIRTARKINHHSSATSLQVAGAVIAGMCWVVENPDRGFVEPEDISDHDYILDLAEEYWGGFEFEKTDWRPSGATGESALQFGSFRRTN